MAVAVRAGDKFLGPVWVAVKGPLTPDREQAFQDAAKLVALHLLCHRAGPDAQNRLRADLVSTMRRSTAWPGLSLPASMRKRGAELLHRVGDMQR
ncbi:hypothetical protein [Streptomyces tauricus]